MSGLGRFDSGQKAVILKDLSSKILRPGIILLSFIAAVGWINYSRWGNPLTFANYQLYNFNIYYPDRLVRLKEFGLFNLKRIPFGIVYYFFPVWALHGPDGHGCG